jgi:hypothetical protein
MRVYFRRAVVMLGLLLIGGSALAQDALQLHCAGSGEATDIENDTVVGRDSDHNRTTAVVQTRNTRPFEGVVELKLDIGSASIRIPPGMFPSIYVSDKTEWLEVTEIEMDEREITGEFKITILSKPDFRIDRVTGEITVSDSSVNFTGTCEKVDTEAAPKF